MAEKPKTQKPKQLTLGLEEPASEKKKTSSSYKVVLTDAKKQQRTTSATPRKKPTVTTRSMTVKIPSDKQTADKKASEATTSKSKRPASVHSTEHAKPHTGQTRTKKNPQTHTTTAVKRKKVEPPKIGKRKAYRTPLSFRILIPLLVAMLFATSIMLYWTISHKAVLADAQKSVPEQRDVVAITVESGMTARTVSLMLEQEGVIDDAQALLSYFVDHELATVIKTGSYLMDRHLDYAQVASILTSADAQVELTIESGFTIASIDRYLQNRLEAEAGSFENASKDLTTAYNLGFAEGWLLSGTYTVHRDRAAEELALKMYQAMLKVVQENLSSALLDTYSIEDLLIIASMIQAETQDVEQMAGISSVIHNRLKAGEPLGIDATTRYELDDWVNPIPTEALEAKTPYNTRRKEGLPPTGISCPSSEAVHAAFFPADTPYFYYLHGNDKEIHFAQTYEEHKQNITDFR